MVTDTWGRNFLAVKRKLVSTRLLKEGMRIDQAIVDGTGRALIEKGAYLDDFQIAYLKTKGIASIFIAEGEVDPDELELQIPQYTRDLIEKAKVPDKPKVKLSESVKKQVCEGVQNLFADPSSENFTDNSVNIANHLTESVLSDDAVAVDLGMLKVSDEYTFKHSVDVAGMSVVIGKNMGLPIDALKELCVAGLLHDVGKAKIPAEVLNKPGKLNDDEFALMKQHSLFGFQILKEKKRFSENIMLGVLQHHEKMNGHGYPQGVDRSRIHKYAKIISVADVFDALVTKRPYKDPFSKNVATEMVMGMSQELDIDMMKIFLHTVILYPVDSIVTLSNGELAKVVENNPDYPLRPKVVGLKHGVVYDLAGDIECAHLIILN